MGGFLGIGGSSAKTDRATELAGFSDLKNIFNYALPQAQTGQATGGSLLGQAGDYFSKLLSGNRATVANAVSPVTNAARSSGDALKRQLASFGTSRGGGVAGANQSIDDKTRAATDTAIASARPAAATGAAQVGQSEMADAIANLGVASTAGADITKLASESRKTSYDINKFTQQDVANTLEGALGAIFQV